MPQDGMWGVIVSHVDALPRLSLTRTGEHVPANSAGTENVKVKREINLL
jgi:hypothetical protein